MKSELHFTLDEILGMEWNTFYYWHRRALEIFGAKCQRPLKEISEIETLANGKVDDDLFKKQLEYIDAKLAEREKSKEGTISG